MLFWNRQECHVSTVKLALLHLNSSLNDVIMFINLRGLQKLHSMFQTTTPYQHAKKVVSDSLGLVDFAVGLVNSVINMPNEQQQQVNFSRKFTFQKNCYLFCSSKIFFGLITLVLEHVSCCLPEWLSLHPAYS